MSKITKKIAVALSAMMMIGALTISASASTGSFSNVDVSGIGYHVFMMNNKGTYDTCDLRITNWGSGSGNIDVELYCGYSYSRVKTVKGTGTTSWNDLFSTYGNWMMDAINTSMNKTRTVSGNWEIL